MWGRTLRRGCTRATSVWSWTQRRRWAGRGLGARAGQSGAGAEGCLLREATWEAPLCVRCKGGTVGTAQLHCLPEMLSHACSCHCCVQAILAAGMGPRRASGGPRLMRAVVERLKRRLRARGFRANYNLQLVCNCLHRQLAWFARWVLAAGHMRASCCGMSWKAASPPALLTEP